MHWYIKNVPVINKISLEVSAQKFWKVFPENTDLKKSKPPKKAINPKTTTMCMKIFFLLTNLIDKFEKIKIGKPINEGIKEVKESLPLTKLTITPHKIKNDP